MKIFVINGQDSFLFETTFWQKIGVDLENIEHILKFRQKICRLLYDLKGLNVSLTDIFPSGLLLRIHSICKDENTALSIHTCFLLQEDIERNKKLDPRVLGFFKSNKIEFVESLRFSFTFFGKNLGKVGNMVWKDITKTENKKTRVKLFWKCDSEGYELLRLPEINGLEELKKRSREDVEKNENIRPKKRRRRNFGKDPVKPEFRNFISVEQIELIKKSGVLMERLQDPQIQEYILKVDEAENKVNSIDNICNEDLGFQKFVNELLFVIGERETVHKSDYEILEDSIKL